MLMINELSGFGSKVLGVVATTTWNPSDKGVGVTLSGGNLEVTSSVNDKGVRAIASASSGLKYYEALITVGVTSMQVGLANSSYPLTNWLGDSTNSVGYSAAGPVYRDGVIATIATYTIGDTICIAADLSNSRIWLRVNSGNWNNSGTADPVTNVGGIDISAISGPIFPACSASGTTRKWTANFGGSAYAQSVPTGYGNW